MGVGGGGEFNETMGIMIDVDNKHQLIRALQNMRYNFSKYDLEKISDDTLSRYGEQVICKKIDFALHKIQKD